MLIADVPASCLPTEWAIVSRSKRFGSLPLAYLAPSASGLCSPAEARVKSSQAISLIRPLTQRLISSDCRSSASPRGPRRSCPRCHDIRDVESRPPASLGRDSLVLMPDQAKACNAPTIIGSQFSHLQARMAMLRRILCSLRYRNFGQKAFAVSG